MTENKSPRKKQPPEISPYVFTVLLLFFGLWCFYDGWLTTDPEMLKHATFNRVLSVVLIPWAVIDYYRMRKRGLAKKAANAEKSPPDPKPDREADQT